MEIKQRLELRKLLIPELRQSLNILALPHLEIKNLIENELESNPLLEETEVRHEPPFPYQNGQDSADLDFRFTQISKKVSLQDLLLRQLGMFTNTDEEFKIGEEIIGNIDEKGYLRVSMDEISASLNLSTDKVEKVLNLIQKFEPAGVGARSVLECLLIQLDLSNENYPLLRKIVEFHLEDMSKKNYSQIAKSLKEPLEKIEPLIKKILRLNPKPGRNYSSEEIQRIIPDILINQRDEDWEITINEEDIPSLEINKDYKDMLKRNNLSPQTKEFLTTKLRVALELLRAVFKRRSTLRKVIEVVAQIQQEAIKDGPAHLKPLTFQNIAVRLNLHESTVCRTVMNKYVQLPWGVLALKDFFPSHIHDKNGQSISSIRIKSFIKEAIDQEDKKHPFSDKDISELLADKESLNVSRRTVAKYREELKILSSTYRREH